LLVNSHSLSCQHKKWIKIRWAIAHLWLTIILIQPNFLKTFLIPPIVRWMQPKSRVIRVNTLGCNQFSNQNHHKILHQFHFLLLLTNKLWLIEINSNRNIRCNLLLQPGKLMPLSYILLTRGNSYVPHNINFLKYKKRKWESLSQKRIMFIKYKHTINSRNLTCSTWRVKTPFFKKIKI
jgi:hypothetical protein